MAAIIERPRSAGDAVASQVQTDMFIATPGHTPSLLKCDSQPVNHIPVIAQDSAPSAEMDHASVLANKENFIPSIAEGRKQSRRAATKRFSAVSPSKINSTSTARTNSSDMSTITVAPAPLRRRDLPNRNSEPPAKRPRYQSEPQVSDEPVKQSLNQMSGLQTSPQRQVGNIAGLLYDETLEISFTSHRRTTLTAVKTMTPQEHAMPLGPDGHTSHGHPQAFGSVSNKPAYDDTDIRTQLPQHFVRASTAHADNHLATGPSVRPAAIPDLESIQPRNVESPTYPASPNQAHFTMRNPLFGVTYEGELQKLDQRPETSSSIYPSPQLQPAENSRHHHDPEWRPNGTPIQLLRNGSSPPTYPPFAQQPSSILPQACQVPLQAPSASPIATIGYGQDFESDVDAKPPYPEPTCQPPALPSPDSIARAPSLSISDNSTSEPESQDVGMSQTAPYGAPDPLSGQHPSQQMRQGLTSTAPVIEHTKPDGESQIGVERRLSERSHLDISSKHDQSKMSPAGELFDDSTFVAKVLAQVDHQRKLNSQTFGRRQAARIHQVLSLAKPPNAAEAMFLSANEAARCLEPNTFFPGIIITRDQQPRPLQSTTEFLNEFYDDDAQIFVQNPAVIASETKPAVPKEVSIGKLKERFLGNRKLQKKGQPWNCLELATHVEDGLRPAFLAGEDCRLLTKLKLPSSKDKAGRRGYDPGWKEVEKWALLAQAGALTEPHQDSHGYNTYITVNQGIIGFGWLANPTAEERAQWRDSPHTFTNGQWRYVILRPGQTVYFPSGTVHFVFRLAAAGDTLAFGGHVLRCSQIVRWIKTIMEERADPDVTNEDLTVSAPAYLDRVEKFVRQALKDGRMDIWGGKENIEEFLALKQQFENKKV